MADGYLSADPLTTLVSEEPLNWTCEGRPVRLCLPHTTRLAQRLQPTIRAKTPATARQDRRL